ncbi:hypothetical protein R1flu_006351 [Riccia fluitans]|uniref:C2H2-type domain-containing protein n=1 Tax=Riccia fluitans TaxID=41844 RepID=A0ABD1YYS6_9MARC
MPGSWSSWKRALSCKTDRDEVVEPPKIIISASGNKRIQTSAMGLHKANSKKHYHNNSGNCSKSLLNLRDVIHGNTRVVHKQCSPRSQTTSDDCLRQQVSPEYIYCDTRSSSGGTPSDVGSVFGRCNSRSGSLTSTPLSHASYVFRGTPLRKLSGCYDCNMAYETLDSMQMVYKDSSLHGSYCGSPKAGCPKCGETFSKAEALEAHHITQHAVTELSKGDSSRNVVEIIFRTSWLKKNELPCGKIERILKVHNTQRIVAKFEEYRDAVKMRAAKMQKKHPRCMADGNELLRFFGTYLQCQLGAQGASNLCLNPNCHCCQLIRSGFHSRREAGKGIYTTATSGKAHDSISLPEDDLKGKRAMLVCRVIAGRTYKAVDTEDVTFLPSGYDSIAGESGPYANIDELLVFSSRAVLPCFVVIYKV